MKIDAIRFINYCIAYMVDTGRLSISLDEMVDLLEDLEGDDAE